MNFHSAEFLVGPSLDVRCSILPALDSRIVPHSEPRPKRLKPDVAVFLKNIDLKNIDIFVLTTKGVWV
jgi:hypothetical protein